MTNDQTKRGAPLRGRLFSMKIGRGMAGSRGESWVAVGVGLFRGGFRDAIRLAQPATQVDLPAARGTKREIRPLGRIAAHVPVADRAAYLSHRLSPPQTCGRAPLSTARYFFPLFGFAGGAGFAAAPSAGAVPPSVFAGAVVSAGLAASVSAF